MAAEAILRCYSYFSAEAGMSSSEDDFRNFFHNPVHDMEFIFWVIFYIAVNVESKDGLMRKKIDAILFRFSVNSQRLCLFCKCCLGSLLRTFRNQAESSSRETEKSESHSVQMLYGVGGKFTEWSNRRLKDIWNS